MYINELVYGKGDLSHPWVKVDFNKRCGVWDGLWERVK